MFCRQSNPLADDSVRLDDNSVLVGQQKAREKTLFLDDQGRTTTTPIPRSMTMIAMRIYFTYPVYLFTQPHHIQFICCSDALLLDRNFLIVDANPSVMDENPSMKNVNPSVMEYYLPYQSHKHTHSPNAVYMQDSI